MIRSTRSVLWSTPLATMTIAALALWGCGGGGGGGGEAGAGGIHADGGAGTGGKGGATTGTGGKAGTVGTGGSAAGAGGSTAGTVGTGGSAAGAGGSAAGTVGTGGSAAGAGGSAAGTVGTGGSAAGAGGHAGTGGAAAGTGGGAAGTGGKAGTGGTGVSCTGTSGCALPGSVNGVCANATCQTCVGSDSACQTAYGSAFICVANNCVMGNCHQSSNCNGQICNTSTNACTACSIDGDCATAYGTGHICQGGNCIAGTCHANIDCGTGGLICNGSSQCVSCGTTDAACVAAYGNGFICVSGACVTGTCHTGAQCNNGQVCSSSNTCANCTDDTGCQNSYGAGHICIGTACVTGTCHTSSTCSNGQICDGTHNCVNCTGDGQCATGQICLSGGCTTGNCRVTATDCSAGGQICTNNVCANCAIDGDCVAGYGANHLCQSGQCVPGNCRAKGGCAVSGLICNTGTLSCGACAADPDCVSEYGADHICSGGVCITGSCHDSTTCNGGQICDPTSHECGACANDSACLNDPKVGANHICLNSLCVTGNCRTAPDCNNPNQICSGNECGACSVTPDCVAAYGANHVCTGGACVSGNCTTSAECGGNQVCDGTTHLCRACAGDGQCTGDGHYGPGFICVANQCLPGNCHDISSECTPGQICGSTTPHVCGGCGTSDLACTNAYSSAYICLANLCVTGNCHDTSTECPAGQLCGVSTAHTCGSCTLDSQCVGDTRYGTGDICFQGACGPGNCHALSSQCTGTNAGLICGVSVTNTCGACLTDGQCQSDTFYGSGDICTTTAGANQGKCASAACVTNNATCSANGSDFCCGNSCTPGNCCVDNDCASSGVACVSHTCSSCNAVSGNKFYVDPVNGNDLTATGSDMAGSTTAPGCAFKTITQAIHQMPATPFAGSQIIIIGTGAVTGLAAGDTLPITLPTNTTLSTTGGPITITLLTSGAGANAGFRLLNNASGIAGNPSAPLTLNGNNHSAGIAVQVAPGTATFTSSLSNVTIQNTLGDAIRVTNGTLTIGAGVVASGSSADGLHITGGAVNINNPSGTQTSFNSNVNGIEVTGLGAISVTGAAGAPLPSNNGTVVTSFNTTGIYIQQTAGTAGLVLNNINGLVAWGSGTRDARFRAGSRVQVRNSVFGAGPEGVRIDTGAGGTAAQNNDISTIDMGKALSFGGNYIQTPNALNGHHSNLGLCLNLAGAQATQTLQVAGNFMTTGANPGVQLNCATGAGTVGKAANCNANPATTVSIGNATPATTTVTETLSMCN